jgi:hypothetical protein
VSASIDSGTDGGGSGTTGGDETTTTDGSVGGIIGLLRANAAALRALILNPRAALVGVALSAALGLLEDAVVYATDLTLLILGGSQPFSYSPTERRWGVADLPLVIVGLALDAGGAAGDAMLAAVTSIRGQVDTLASQAGLFAPIVALGLEALLVVAGVFVLRLLVSAAASYVPGAEYVVAVFENAVGAFFGGDG